MIPKNKDQIIEVLEKLYPDATCELNYQKDYELLIAVVLSAQCTDKRVNLVTKELFSLYTLEEISTMEKEELEKIIKPIGTYTKKASYVKSIAQFLIKDYDSHVPNNRDYLESLPGVGRKTCNVVLSNLFKVPAFAVDTHVSRVSKRLNLVRETDDVTKIERKLMSFFPIEKWGDLHHQMVLFGRYVCKSQNPSCETCQLKKYCKYYQNKNK